MICEKATESLQALAHWNYFLAIEQDLMQLSRYIEFSEENYQTYSIELARLLIASTSEVDVLLRDFCTEEKKKKDMTIHDYRDFFHDAEEWDIQRKSFIREIILLPRYNLYFQPWESWQLGGKEAPEWWTANNKVKHHRSTNYNLANLKNVLSSISALLLVNLFCIQRMREWPDGTRPELEAPRLLEPSNGLHIYGDFYR